MAPGDLNLKKSWNPALLKNQKKVWEKEQEALKEFQTIKQRAKEIASEREKEEMIRLQYGNNTANLPTKQKLELNKLGWMYNDVPKPDKVNEAGFREVEEDFLLNKEGVELLLKGGTAVKRDVASRFDKVASVGKQTLGASFSDDPILRIRQEQMKMRTSRERSDRSGDDRHRSRHRSSSSRSKSDHERSDRTKESSDRRGSTHRSDSSHRKESSHRVHKDSKRPSREGR